MTEEKKLIPIGRPPKKCLKCINHSDCVLQWLGGCNNWYLFEEKQLTEEADGKQ